MAYGVGDEDVQASKAFDSFFDRAGTVCFFAHILHAMLAYRHPLSLSKEDKVSDQALGILANGSNDESATRTLSARKDRAYALNDNCLHSMLFLYLSSQVLRPAFAGHIIDSDIRALLCELDTNKFA